MTINNGHKSLSFIKINDPPEEMHLLTYSSLHVLAVNSKLPVFPAWFLAAEFISIKQLVAGFTAQDLFCRSAFSALLCSVLPESSIDVPKSFIFIICFHPYCDVDESSSFRCSPVYVAANHVFMHCKKKKKNNLTISLQCNFSSFISKITIFLISLHFK